MASQNRYSVGYRIAWFPILDSFEDRGACCASGKRARDSRILSLSAKVNFSSGQTKGNDIKRNTALEPSHPAWKQTSSAQRRTASRDHRPAE